MSYDAGEFDIAVIGAGHAGTEAALAAARLGARTVCFGMNLDSVGNMPCNPSIGGPGKSQLVREIDALGGEMARAADACCIQYRVLNTGKGPAVRSLRAQADRRKYQGYMKSVLESCENLWLKQGEIVDIEIEDGAVRGVVTETGAVYRVRAAVIAAGTYLGGRIIVGGFSKSSGPDGMFPSNALCSALAAKGIGLRRFKTGTPPRINRRSVDFSKGELQPGDPAAPAFSFATKTPPNNIEVCHLFYTTEETHRLIRENLHLAPMYSGEIKGVGARYCPSIEDKVVRFADKERHQLFLEPTGMGTGEMYLQGFSSSMPEEIQHKMLRTVPGFENAEIMRPAYAIEYECADPLLLRATLEFKEIRGLYGAGQFNGTSGYEEAAAQGLMAGINAAHKILDRPPVVISRGQGYIGTLIDDLVTKGTQEPYRMMTSRSEYRLFLRQDNADIRLLELAEEIGLLPRARIEATREKYAAVEKEIRRLEKTFVPPSPALAAILAGRGHEPVAGVSLGALLRRPGLSYRDLAEIDEKSREISPEVAEQAEIDIKYSGYIKRDLVKIEQLSKMENRRLPPDLDYMSVPVLRIEARQKFMRFRPETLGQASRISGVSPADISALIIWLETYGKGRKNKDGK